MYRLAKIHIPTFTTLLNIKPCLEKPLSSVLKDHISCKRWFKGPVLQGNWTYHNAQPFSRPHFRGQRGASSRPGPLYGQVSAYVMTQTYLYCEYKHTAKTEPLVSTLPSFYVSPETVALTSSVSFNNKIWSQISHISKRFHFAKTNCLDSYSEWLYHVYSALTSSLVRNWWQGIAECLWGNLNWP